MQHAVSIYGNKNTRINAKSHSAIFLIETASSLELTGWICSNQQELALVIEAPEKREFQVSWQDRPDVAQAYSKHFSHATGMKVKFAKPLSFNELRNLTISILFNSNGTTEGMAVAMPSSPLFLVSDFNEHDFSELFFYAKQFGIFDAAYYAVQAGLPTTIEPEEAFRHYVQVGWKDNHNPHALFSTAYYLKKNKDVRDIGVSPLTHYLRFGHSEDRWTSPDFDPEFYKKKYGKSIPGDVSSLQHYLNVGVYQNLSPVDWLDEQVAANIRLQHPNQYPNLVYKHEKHRVFVPNKALAPQTGRPALQKSKGEARPIDIVLPFYKEPYLMSMQARHLLSLSEELKSLKVRLFAILDSPDDAAACEEFRSFVKTVGPKIELIPITNSRNIGFIQSCNRAMHESLSSKHDVLLLNSDCFPTYGSLSEMVAAATNDPMIGFVCPRSNNATICTFPGIHGHWHEQHEQYLSVRELFPRITYTPTAVGFCLLIKYKILAEFGLLDAAYGQGYNEENDLVMRANRYGYRSAIANHAYAFHMGQQSFSGTGFSDNLTAPLLEKRFPEYRLSLTRYQNSQDLFYEKTLSGACPRNGKYRVLLDASSMGPHKNGTSEFIKHFSRGLAALNGRFEFSILASSAAAKAHELNTISNLNVIDQWPSLDNRTDQYAAVLRLNQPFDMAPITKGIKAGYAYACFMLDSIAYDCQYLYNESTQNAWELLYQVADGIVYQSNFTARQFGLRFECMRQPRTLVSYHSLDPDEYSEHSDKSAPSKLLTEVQELARNRKLIFIVGNHFSHKDVSRTYSILASHFPNVSLVVLGHRDMAAANWHHFTRILHAGEVPDDVIEYLYSASDVIVFPSHYEGFGFPLLNAAHSKRPLVLRSTVVAHELMTKLGSSLVANTFESIDDLPDVVARTLNTSSVTPRTTRKGRKPHQWEDSAIEVSEFLLELIHMDRREMIARRHSFLRLLK